MLPPKVLDVIIDGEDCGAKEFLLQIVSALSTEFPGIYRVKTAGANERGEGINTAILCYYWKLDAVFIDAMRLFEYVIPRTLMREVTESANDKRVRAVYKAVRDVLEAMDDGKKYDLSLPTKPAVVGEAVMSDVA